MPEAPDQFIRQHMDSEENLLWSGQPRQGILFRPQDLYLIPFSLMWGGFAILWEIMALKAASQTPGPTALIFPLFGLPFVAVGLYVIFGRFFVDARARANTFYGVTSERVIICSGQLSQKIKSLHLPTLSDITLSERSDGSGTVTLGPSHYLMAWFPAGAWPGAGRYAPPSFEMIPDAKRVYDIIRRAQKSST